MNPNDLPLKEKLAALIEAGRLTHPNVQHISGKWGDGKESGCAMTFALLGAGADLATIDPFLALSEATGLAMSELEPMARRVIEMNDRSSATLPEIVEAIRTDSLPRVHRRSQLGDYLSLFLSPDMKVTVASHGDFNAAWMKTVSLTPFVPAPAKKTRISSKTKAMWPAPKHAYA